MVAGTSRFSNDSRIGRLFRFVFLGASPLNHCKGFQPLKLWTMINLFSAPVAGGADLEEPKTMPGSHSLTVLIAWNRRLGLNNLNIGNAIARAIRQ